MSEYEKYRTNLAKLISADETAEAAEEVDKLRANLPPESDIDLRNSLTMPDMTDDILSKNMRTAYLSKEEFLVARKGGIFLTWLDGFVKSNGLDEDNNLIALRREIHQDIAIILNLSVAKKGWLLDNLLNPKKRFSFFNEGRQEKKMLRKNEGDGN